MERAVIATTDLETLPDATTWYLELHIRQVPTRALCPEACLEEVIRLYGLRMWIEQSYKQVRGALGWAEYQVRSDRAIRRHWQLVCFLLVSSQLEFRLNSSESVWEAA